MTMKKFTGAFRRLLTMTLALVMVLGSAMPVHYVLPPMSGLPRRSMVLGEATTRLIRDDLLRYMCSTPREVYVNVDRAVRNGMRKKCRHKNRKNKRRPNGKFRGKKG